MVDLLPWTPNGSRPSLHRTPTDGSIRMCPAGRLEGNLVPLQIGYSDLQVTSQPDRVPRMARRFIAPPWRGNALLGIRVAYG